VQRSIVYGSAKRSTTQRWAVFKRRRIASRAGEVIHLPKAGYPARIAFALVGRATSATLSEECREAVFKELQQLRDYDVLIPVHIDTLTPPQQIAKAVDSSCWSRTRSLPMEPSSR